MDCVGLMAGSLREDSEEAEKMIENAAHSVGN